MQPKEELDELMRAATWPDWWLKSWAPSPIISGCIQTYGTVWRSSPLFVLFGNNLPAFGNVFRSWKFAPTSSRIGAFMGVDNGWSDAIGAPEYFGATFLTEYLMRGLIELRLKAKGNESSPNAIEDDCSVSGSSYIRSRTNWQRPSWRLH
jgi:hypothetical protein